MCSCYVIKLYMMSCRETDCHCGHVCYLQKYSFLFQYGSKTSKTKKICLFSRFCEKDFDCSKYFCRPSRTEIICIKLKCPKLFPVCMHQIIYIHPTHSAHRHPSLHTLAHTHPIQRRVQEF